MNTGSPTMPCHEASWMRSLAILKTKCRVDQAWHENNRCHKKADPPNN